MINYELGLRFFQLSFPFDISEKGKCIMSNWENKIEFDPSHSFAELETLQFSDRELIYLDLNQTIYEKDTGRIKHDCGCFTCSNNYTRAYIHHLLKCKELNAGVLLTL